MLENIVMTSPAEGRSQITFEVRAELPPSKVERIISGLYAETVGALAPENKFALQHVPVEDPWYKGASAMYRAMDGDAPVDGMSLLAARTSGVYKVRTGKKILFYDRTREYISYLVEGDGEFMGEMKSRMEAYAEKHPANFFNRLQGAMSTELFFLGRGLIAGAGIGAVSEMLAPAVVCLAAHEVPDNLAYYKLMSAVLSLGAMRVGHDEKFKFMNDLYGSTSKRFTYGAGIFAGYMGMRAIANAMLGMLPDADPAPDPFKPREFQA